MSSEAKIFAVLSHVSYFFFPILLPVILMLIKQEDEFVKHHAKQALIFHVSLLVAGIVAWILCFVLIGFLLLPAIAIFGLIVTIIAIIRSVEGEYYRYPVVGNWLD